MLRSLKRLFGIWEPKEGVWYEEKYFSNTFINTECSLDGQRWFGCKFRLINGVYEVYMTTYDIEGKRIVNKKRLHFKIKKEYVEVKRIKQGAVGCGADKITRWVKGKVYELLVKDPSKIEYLP